MKSIVSVLTPEHIYMIKLIEEHGSLAAAARHMGVVPSALTYKVRQLEDILDVLLIDRQKKKAVLTPAAKVLLQEGLWLLEEMDGVVTRLKRVANGWESKLTLAIDELIDDETILSLCKRFHEENQCTTQIVWSNEILNGGWESLETGRADLMIGLKPANIRKSQYVAQWLGDIPFGLVVAPFHPLAHMQEPIGDAQLVKFPVVAVADSAQRSKTNLGILEGQTVFTVPNLSLKIRAQMMGLGCGFLPLPRIRKQLASGSLIALATKQPARMLPMHICWRDRHLGPALQWWITQLTHPVTQKALLQLD